MANHHEPEPTSLANSAEPQRYGATSGVHKKAKPRRSSQLNFAVVCFCVFVPWVLFCLMFAVTSFELHHQSKELAYLFTLLGLVMVGALMKLAYDAVQRHRVDPTGDPNWLIFMAVACLIAWLFGVVLGDMNYFYNLHPFYEVSSLNSYPNVDPSRTPGQQVMDAGTMTFASGSSIDSSRAMGFHNSDIYCVAPIITSAAITSYDFWAVGLNCCTGESGSFSCGEYNNPHAASGLRVMRDDQRAFYRLAVKQAEAAYSIKANHPLFFHWMQAPLTEIEAYMDEGYKHFFLGAFSFFAFMVFSVIVAALVFARN
mmetsp:Transcript_35758/g.56977  ORF Transcript_35758/g.56977 Transcript_35758/m.56977 type:complete len:313 (-) Transcript_35758:51-989(-)